MSCDSFHPKTRTAIGPEARGFVRVIETEPVVGECDLKFFVEGQERFEQVLLVQRHPALDQPLSRVIVREEDIVYVYPDAGREPWQ